MLERPRVMRELTCELDDRTRLEYGMKLVKELDSISKAKAAIKFHQKEAERLVSVLSEGFEIRPVECQEIPYYAEGVMHLCRLDTYETLSVREMTDEERNGNLFAEVDNTKGSAGETKPVEGDQVDPETAAQADADAAIEKQISEEETAEADPSGLPPMTEEIAEQIERDMREATDGESAPEPVAEVRPRRRKQGRRA